MMHIQSVTLAIAWAFLTVFIYYLAQRHDAVTGEPGETPDCLVFAHLLIAATFGRHFWTWRGFGATTFLCWSFGSMMLVSEGPFRIGASGYPAIELLALAAFSLLPFWVHGIIHTTRKFLEASAEHQNLRVAFAVLLPFVPAITLAATLIPVAVLAGMVDAESIVPHDVGGAWISLLDMAAGTWWPLGKSGTLPTLFMPLGIPTISCCLYLASFMSWNFLYVLARRLRLSNEFLARRHALVVGMFNVVLAFCYGLALGNSPILE